MEQRLGVGGSAAYLVVPAQYTFTLDDGTVKTIVEQVRIAEPTATNLYLPSILGWDILQHFALFMDWRTQVVQLR